MRWFPLSLLFTLLAAISTAVTSSPVADVHTHYKWSQKGVTTPEQVIATLKQHNIELAVVIGTPAEMALDIERLDPERIIPIWSPYRIGGDWSRWAFDKTTLVRAREALASGHYQGIGELHLIGGFAPKPDTAVVNGLLSLGAQYDVPVMLHTEFSRPSYLLTLCTTHPDTRVLWSHAGSILPVQQVAEVMAACPNVWVELAARDPWRFVNNPIADEAGQLLPEWRALIMQWPSRFMIGTDPVWPVDQMDGWDTDDTGWQEYGRFIEFHLGWLAGLDEETADKIRYRNARKFFLGDAR